MNFKANIFKTITLTVIASVLSSCDPEEALSGPSPLLVICNESGIGVYFEEYEGKTTYKTEQGNHFLLYSSTEKRYSAPTINFEEWFPKVMQRVDSIVITAKDKSIRKVWKKTDDFEENERHPYNINFWEKEVRGYSEWQYILNQSDLM